MNNAATPPLLSMAYVPHTEGHRYPVIIGVDAFCISNRIFGHIMTVNHYPHAEDSNSTVCGHTRDVIRAVFATNQGNHDDQ